MAFSRTDEVDLLTALHEGPHEQPRWATFLARMQRRTRADHVALIVGRGDVPIRHAPYWFAGRNVRAQVEQLEELAALDPTPYRGLRPGRVYSAMELIDPEDAGHSRFRREFLERIGIRYGRYMRVTVPGGPDAWLTITRAADEFSAADSALLSALAPHLAIAVRTLNALEEVRLREAIADDALRRCGIGWTAADRNGRPVETGGAPPGPWPGGLLGLPLPDRPGAIATVVTATAFARQAPPLGARAAAALERLFRLTAQEARLAVHLANGGSLAEAAAALGLTVETARNYSKRLFGKTGTRGQGDLVRVVLSSVAILA